MLHVLTKIAKLALISVLMGTILPACFSSADEPEVDEAVVAEGEGESAEFEDEANNEGDFSDIEDDNFGDLGDNQVLGDNNFGVDQQFESDAEQQLGDVTNNTFGAQEDNLQLQDEQLPLNQGLDALDGSPEGEQNAFAGSADLAAPVALGDAAAPPTEGVRVVRYTTRDDSPVFASKDKNGAPVATYPAGTSVLVILDGEWAEITADRFMEVSELSVEAVPRSRTNAAWQ
ncbi:MAG: hypothetical protein OXT67_09170 [Zetaproteobacteria bacterium]|nr:hypothetical protein [Zetaproteobacteria bacterium]